MTHLTRNVSLKDAATAAAAAAAAAEIASAAAAAALSDASDKKVTFVDEVTRQKKPQVLERGTGSNEDFYLHKQQQGRLIGTDSISSRKGRKYASSMITDQQNNNNIGNGSKAPISIIRRRGSDGLRLDTEAIGDESENEGKDEDNDVTDNDDDDAQKDYKVEDIPSKFASG